MSADEKPFVCDDEGCKMRFTNEDHLAVHKKKHEMCLSLTSAINQKSMVILDQTPTPTRFIRNCEEVGLFQDLQNVNPFDEQFRKAVQQPNSSLNIHNLTVPSDDNDTLNTPAIYSVSLHPDGAANVSTAGVPSTNANDAETDIEMVNDSGANIPTTSESASYEISLKPGGNSAKDAAGANLAASHEPLQKNASDVIPPQLTHTIMASTNNAAPSGLKPLPTNIIPVTKPVTPPVIAPSIVIHVPEAVTTTPSVVGNVHIAQLPPNMMKADNSSNVRTATITKPILPQVLAIKNDVSHSNIPILPATNKATTEGDKKPVNVQVILRLQDGTEVPVQMPESSLNSTPLSNASNTVGSLPSLSTKQKLKQALNQNQTPAKHVKATSAPVSTASDIISNMSTIQFETSSNDSLQSSSNVRTRSRSSDDDPEEKRQKFLERNRAAATRCRLKRKSWIDSLESKAQQLSKVNVRLQKEVSSLRDEVSYLKTLLLAHKDCPVTLQQIQNSNSTQANEPQANDITAVTSNVINECDVYHIMDTPEEGSTTSQVSHYDEITLEESSSHSSS